MFDVEQRYDAIIVGAGVAGLNAALFLPRDKKILLVSKESPAHSDSYLAQGGICVLKWDGDYETYFEDTMRAGHFENNPEAVACMLRSSRETIADLLNAGVRFAKDEAGNFLYTREGGHRRARIMYREDCTGKEITSRLYRRVKALPNVRIRPYTVLLDILERDGECRGAVLRDGKTGEVKPVAADYVILATGGVGGLFDFSTNFRNLTGDGVAVCLKHGVATENVDYIQIHPTTLYTKRKGRRFLISESVRGEGARLLDSSGKRFTDELQPRDVVTAAIYGRMKEEGSDHVFLDFRKIPPSSIREHFPAIAARCAKEGYDVFSEPVPVVPGQHYFMGGIRSDLDGKTSMPRLFAVGETCCNGVHGKNRLASNSLLESLIFAKRAALLIGNEYRALTEREAKNAVCAFDKNAYADGKAIGREYRELVLGEMERSRAARETDGAKEKNNRKGETDDESRYGKIAGR